MKSAIQRSAILLLAAILSGCASYKEPPTVPLLAPDGEIIGKRNVNLSGGKGKVLFCQHRTDGSDWCMVLKGGWAYWYEARE